MAYTFDVNNYTEVSRQLDKIRSQMGVIDLAIVCAGVGELNPELSFEKEMPTIQTNILGWTATVDCLYAIFERQGYGHLAAITSVGGLAGAAEAPAYSASKAYQINYTQSLCKKAHKRVICVTEIRPGLVDTAMAKGEGLFWVMPVEKVVGQIVKAIAKKKSRCVVTKRWRIVSFILKHFMR